MSALRQRRKAKGLSLKALAERLRVSINTAWSWENGVTQPRPKHYPQLAFELGMESLDLAQLIDQQSIKRY